MITSVNLIWQAFKHKTQHYVYYIVHEHQEKALLPLVTFHDLLYKLTMHVHVSTLYMVKPLMFASN